MLKFITLKQAFILLLIVNIISLAVILAVHMMAENQTNILTNHHMEDRKKSLKYRVKNAQIAVEGMEVLEKNGIMPRTIAQETAIKMIREMAMDPTHYVFIMDDKGHMVFNPIMNDHTIDSTVGTSSRAMMFRKLLNTSKNSYKGTMVYYKQNNTTKASYVYRTQLWHWSIMSTNVNHDIIHMINALVLYNMLIMLLIVVSGFLSILFIIAVMVNMFAPSSGESEE